MNELEYDLLLQKMLDSIEWAKRHGFVSRDLPGMEGTTLLGYPVILMPSMPSDDRQVGIAGNPLTSRHRRRRE